MTDQPKRFGRPAIYPFVFMAVGDTATLDAPTGADAKRIHRAASNVAVRNDWGFRGKMNRKTRLITFTRVR